MLKLKKHILFKKNGSVDIIITTIIGILVLLIIIAALMPNLQSVSKYAELNRITRKYALLLETNGVITYDEISNLKKDLEKRNFNIDNLTIESSPSINDKVSFGKEFIFSLTYINKKTEFELKGFTVNKKEIEQPMRVRITSICKSANAN